MDEAQTVVEEALLELLNRKITDWGKMKNTMKDALSGYVWKKMKRRPMILPIIMEVE